MDRGTLETAHLKLALQALHDKFARLVDARDIAQERVNTYSAKADIFGLGREHLEEQLSAAQRAVDEIVPAVNALQGHVDTLEAKAARQTRSVTLSFTLSMPGRKSWNGRWSGENKLYVLTRTFRGADVAKARALAGEGSYSYRWDDGWCASVAVAEVDSREASKLRRKSAGFCGYDWMVSAIVAHGRIVADHELKKEAEHANA